VIAGLYTLWQLAASVSVLGTSGAYARARWLVRVEHDWYLPSEQSTQRLILGHPVLEQASNVYYATMHFTVLGAFLLWLFIRHRDRYAFVRNVVVAFTAASLLIQLVPVAPPRLLPEFGFVDTAAQYGQSVYALSGISVDQLAAMPSVHVGWAVLVAWAVVWLSPSPSRWWILLHPAITCFVVVVTANHFWADGIGAAFLLIVTVGVTVALRPPFARPRVIPDGPLPIPAVATTDG
jgi:hypothetical protein